MTDRQTALNNLIQHCGYEALHYTNEGDPELAAAFDRLAREVGVIDKMVGFLEDSAMQDKFPHPLNKKDLHGRADPILRRVRGD